MNKKMIAAVAPLALALPLALAGPASAAPVHRDKLLCNIDARAIRGNLIYVNVSVNGRARGRQDLVLKLEDSGRTVGREAVRERLPFNDFAVIRNQHGPDFINFSAYDRTTGQRCSDSTVVWR